MNATVKSVNGTFNVVSFVDQSKVDQLAALLGLTAAQASALKTGDVIVVTPSA